MAGKKGAKKGVIGGAINKESFEQLCAIGCTREEVIAVLGTTEPTFIKWIKATYGEDANFSSVYPTFFARTKASLRRRQIKQSEDSIQMSIWLGKQWLGQSDKVENTNVDKVEIISNIPEEDIEDE